MFVNQSSSAHVGTGLASDTQCQRCQEGDSLIGGERWVQE